MGTLKGITKHTHAFLGAVPNACSQHSNNIPKLNIELHNLNFGSRKFFGEWE